ncbi:MAG: YigZ family protein [Chlorobi bacterium]|nr:YigZ family protein [Chlorobiota bacterium]
MTDNIHSAVGGNDPDEYATVSGEREAEIKVQGSRFIAFLRPLADVAEFHDWLTTVRKRFHDATHHCYAYRIGARGETWRTSDDGEPSGTAGARILEAMASRDLVYCGVIVVRYFGGTKLGVGGLGRAYFNAARAVVERARVERRYITLTCRIHFPFSHTQTVHRALEKFSCRIVDQDYGDVVTYTVRIRRSLVTQLESWLTDQSAGVVVLEQNL